MSTLLYLNSTIVNNVTTEEVDFTIILCDSELRVFSNFDTALKRNIFLYVYITTLNFDLRAFSNDIFSVTLES